MTGRFETESVADFSEMRSASADTGFIISLTHFKTYAGAVQRMKSDQGITLAHGNDAKGENLVACV